MSKFGASVTLCWEGHSINWPSHWTLLEFFNTWMVFNYLFGRETFFNLEKKLSQNPKLTPLAWCRIRHVWYTSNITLKCRFQTQCALCYRANFRNKLPSPFRFPWSLLPSLHRSFEWVGKMLNNDLRFECISIVCAAEWILKWWLGIWLRGKCTF